MLFSLQFPVLHYTTLHYLTTSLVHSLLLALFTIHSYLPCRAQRKHLRIVPSIVLCCLVSELSTPKTAREGQKEFSSLQITCYYVLACLLALY